MTNWPRFTPASNLIHGLLVVAPLLLLISIALFTEVGMIEKPRYSRSTLSGIGLAFTLAVIFCSIVSTKSYLFLVFMPDRFWLLLATGLTLLVVLFIANWWIETLFSMRQSEASLFYFGLLLIGSLANGIVTGCRTGLRRQATIERPEPDGEDVPIVWFGLIGLFSSSLVLSLAAVALGYFPWRQVGPWINSIMGI